MTRERKAYAKGWREACDVMIHGLKREIRGLKRDMRDDARTGNFGSAAENWGGIAECDALLVDALRMKKDGGSRD